MVRSSNNIWLHRLAVLTAGVTLFLIWIGGLVTSHGVGMSVPDWPTTYGYNMFFFPFSKWVGGIFYEHSHRLVASLVGMLTAFLAAWIWARETSGWTRRAGLGAIVVTLGLMGVRTQTMFVVVAAGAAALVIFCLIRLRGEERPLRWWALIAFSAVLIQGVLGGLRVTQMKDAIGIFHGTLAQLFFALICSLALVTSRWWTGSAAASPTEERVVVPRAGFAAATMLILGQLILGAAMRHQHAGLAIPDFPTAYGKAWPDTGAAAVARHNQQRGEVRALNPITSGGILLQMTHRAVAFVILLAVAWLAGATLRRAGVHTATGRLALAWLGLIVVQACLGAATIWTDKAADIATAHVATGGLSLVTGTMLTLVALRRVPATGLSRDYFLTREAVRFDARPVQVNA